MKDENLILAWGGSTKPIVKLSELHHALREALCYRFVFRNIVFVDNTRTEVYYEESTGGMHYILTDKSSGKDFDAKIPYPFHKVSPGEFMAEWMYAQDLWEASTPNEQYEVYKGSYVKKNLNHLLDALAFRGFKAALRSS